LEFIKVPNYRLWVKFSDGNSISELVTSDNEIGVKEKAKAQAQSKNSGRQAVSADFSPDSYRDTKAV
jgi:hypothetical protein